MKIRGFRVELDEVEAAILACEEVVEVAVLAMKIEDSSHAIKTAVIFKEGAKTNDEAVRKSIAVRLLTMPFHVKYFTVSNFPRTSIGKIDRYKLEKEMRKWE